MRIIHCISSLGTGGAERTLVRLVNNSKDNHFIITILCRLDLKKFLADDINVYSIFPPKFKRLKE